MKFFQIKKTFLILFVLFNSFLFSAGVCSLKDKVDNLEANAEKASESVQSDTTESIGKEVSLIQESEVSVELAQEEGMEISSAISEVEKTIDPSAGAGLDVTTSEVESLGEAITEEAAEGGIEALTEASEAVGEAAEEAEQTAEKIGEEVGETVASKV